MKKVLTFFVFSFVFESCFVDSCKDSIETIRTQEYEGIIIEKFEHKNRNTPYIVLRGKNGTVKTVYFNYAIYKEIDTGDYVRKDNGSLKHIVSHDSTRITYYPVCGSYIYKDSIVVEKRTHNIYEK